MSIIVSDNSINRAGFRVITAGIDFSDFKKNPVMFYNHNRNVDNNTAANLPIGRWENVRVEGDKLLADPVFDTEDEFALKVKSKYDQGIINTASIGIDRYRLSDLPSDLMEGQELPTVVSCKLKEISLVDIPMNANAVRLVDATGATITLSDITREYFKTNPKKEPDMNLTNISSTLNLKDGATEADVIVGISALKSERDIAFAKLKAIELAANNTVIDAAISEGRMKEADRPVFEKLMAVDADSAKAAIASLVKAPALHKVPGTETPAGETLKLAAEWDALDKQNGAPLLKLKADDPERYALLKAAKFGSAPKK